MPRLVSIAIAALLALIPQHGAHAAEALPLTDVFTAGSDGYHTYRIPALIVSPSGTLLLFCEGRKTSRSDHGDVDLVLKRSTDGGQTWGSLQLVYEEGGDRKITIGNPCPVVDRETGVVWLPFTRDNDDVFITSSTDDGETWSEPQNITSDVKAEDWTWYATGPGNGIQLTGGEHRGRLVIPCDHRVKGESDRRRSSRSHVIYSDDHGQTWQRGRATDWSMNECAVVELSDGRLLLNMRSNRGKARRGIASSTDGGKTWSDVDDDDELIEPVCQASLIQHHSAKGDDLLLFSNPASTERRENLTIRASGDEGRTWPVSKTVYPGSAAYSSLAILPSGEIGIALERDNYGRISFARCTMQWLTADDAAGSGD